MELNNELIIDLLKDKKDTCHNLGDTEISGILTVIQEFLNNDYRKTLDILDLYNNIGELSLDETVMKLSAITECPVIILNISYSVVSRYPRDRFNLPAKSSSAWTILYKIGCTLASGSTVIIQLGL